MLMIPSSSNRMQLEGFAMVKVDLYELEKVGKDKVNDCLR